MVCKEEVFNWFKEASGAKRIELMCGLMSMCIPLEVRFFEAIVRDLAKKDFNFLREAELKANSYPDLDAICACNLLADKVDPSEKTITSNSEPTHAPHATHAVTTNCSKPQVMPVMPMDSHAGQLCVSANGTSLPPMSTMNTLNASNDMMANAINATPAPPSNLSLLSSRSKLIVSLCLLSPTNRSCSPPVFKALSGQLTAKNISSVVMHCFFTKGCVNYDDLFSEVLLMLTMAVHHPAFSFENRVQLAKQKEEVELTIESVNSQLRQTNFSNAAPHYTPFHHSHHLQYAHHHYHAGIPSTMPLPNTNLAYSTAANQMPAPLPNQMSNLRIANMSSPVSSPSPTSSPSSSKVTATSVSAISPLHFPQELSTHVLSIPDSNTTAPYILTGIPPTAANVIEDMNCAKNIASCYNCGTFGHRGDECTAQTQDEATR